MPDDPIAPVPGGDRRRGPPVGAILFTVLAVANLVLLVATRHGFNAALAIVWGMIAWRRWVQWSKERDSY